MTVRTNERHWRRNAFKHTLTLKNGKCLWKRDWCRFGYLPSDCEFWLFSGGLKWKSRSIKDELPRKWLEVTDLEYRNCVFLALLRRNKVWQFRSHATMIKINTASAPLTTDWFNSYIHISIYNFFVYFVHWMANGVMFRC